MDGKAINIKTLNMDELAGVVNLYPWYGAARKELCRRMAALGGESWGVEQYADQAMYIPDRKSVAEIIKSGGTEDYADRDLETLLHSYIEEKTGEKASARPVRAAGGDFFSQTAYESVRKDDDNVFSRRRPDAARPCTGDHDDAELDFCTETLARIYAGQGYFEQAKRIYGKLILAFPEKSAYFASLIEILDKQINNQTL